MPQTPSNKRARPCAGDSGDPGALVIQFRLENGLCYQCGAKVYDINNNHGRRRIVPRDDPGIARAGRCLHCYPDVPTVRTAASPPIPPSVSASAGAGAGALDPPSPRPPLAAIATPSTAQKSEPDVPVSDTGPSQLHRGAPPEGCARDEEGSSSSSSSSSLGLSSFDSSDDDASAERKPRAVARPERVTSSSNVTGGEITILDAQKKPFIGTLVDGTIDEGKGTFTHMHKGGDFKGETSTYVGDIKHGNFHGQGKRTNANGEVYEGEFRNGAAEGLGSWESGDGEWEYEGEFKRDKRHGHGTCRQTKEGGEVYEGEYKNNKQHGKGKLQFAGGGEYDGEFKNNKLHGKGRYEFSDGSVYEGNFKNDLRDGVGVMTYTTEELVRKYEGHWKENSRHGKGTLTHIDKSVFTGRFKNDQKHGIGVLTMPDGTRTEEEWVDGTLIKQDGSSH